jgi:hypothetical protein
VTVSSCGRTASSQCKSVTLRFNLCYSAALKFCSFGCILNIKVSQDVAQIFCSSVKPVELQWVIIQLKEITTLILFILIFSPCKNL